MVARHRQGSCNTKCVADQRREPSRQSLPAHSRSRKRPGTRPQALSVTVRRVPPVPVAQRRSSLWVDAGHPTLPHVRVHHLAARWIAAAASCAGLTPPVSHRTPEDNPLLDGQLKYSFFAETCTRRFNSSTNWCSKSIVLIRKDLAFVGSFV